MHRDNTEGNVLLMTEASKQCRVKRNVSRADQHSEKQPRTLTVQISESAVASMTKDENKRVNGKVSTLASISRYVFRTCVLR